MSTKARSLFDREIIVPAMLDSLRKLNPVHMWKNPVMFVTEVGAAVTTLDLAFTRPSEVPFVVQISVWLWFTVIFANFAEAMAEGRGKAQAETLRKSRTKTRAKRRNADGTFTWREAEALEKGDVFVVAVGEMIAADGEIIEGAATIDESAITGESAPVIREVGRRPLGRHRRHQSPLRRNHRPRHRQRRRVVHGPHDRAHRRRQAAEDAQRNRPLDPALGVDDHLPGGGRHDDALRHLHPHLPRRRPRPTTRSAWPSRSRSWCRCWSA